MKKQKSATVSAAERAVTAPTTTDLKALIHDHSLFFDKLIDLIPPRFYLPNDDADNKPWIGGLSKAAKASLKRQNKEQLKLGRRNRFDPDKKDEQNTTQILKHSLEIQQKTDSIAEEGGEDAEPINLGDDNNPNSNSNDNSSVTYEELRQRLRRKIEMLRGNRGESSKNNDNKRKRIEQGSKSEPKKRKRGEEEGDTNGEDDLNSIEYGKIKIGDDDDEKKKKKKRKVNKAKELERLKRLEEVKRENRTVADREAWKTAEMRAMGVKVHDDPSKLKKSMKKEKRKKEKSSEKWKERVESREKLQEERQRKRRDNIAGKAKEKKMRKIAKREKKLMRPGFEGRKEGYIT